MVELQLRVVQESLFPNFVEALSDLFSEAHFKFSGTGLELQAMDTDREVLVALPFDDYKCGWDLSVGLNLADMAMVLRSAYRGDTITINADWAFSETLVDFTFDSPEAGGGSYFGFVDSVSVDGLPVEIPESPEEEYRQAMVSMPGSQFMRMCKRLSSFGDRNTDVTISVDEEHVDFFVEPKPGVSIIHCRKAQTVDNPEESTVIKMKDMKEKVYLIFPLRYINSFSKLSNLSDQVTISLSSKRPAVFEYKIAKMGYVRYYMLPSIINEKDRKDGLRRQILHVAKYHKRKRDSE